LEFDGRETTEYVNKTTDLYVVWMDGWVDVRNNKKWERVCVCVCVCVCVDNRISRNKEQKAGEVNL